jgi:hypothetical protein
MHKIDKRGGKQHFPSYSLRKCITICFAQAYQTADEVMLGVQIVTVLQLPLPN